MIKAESGKAWLAWFVAQPQVWCAKCRVMNEVKPPSWWRGNCRHARSRSIEYGGKSP